MIVNAPDRLPSGDRVVRHLESRRNWPIVDLSDGQVSARRRHAAGISVRCCDSLTDMETCYRCCRGKVYTLVVAGSTGPMSSIIVRSHPNPRYPTDNPQAVPGQPKTAKRTKDQRSNRSTVKRANELNIPQSTIHTPQSPILNPQPPPHPARRRKGVRTRSVCRGLWCSRRAGSRRGPEGSA